MASFHSVAEAPFGAAEAQQPIPIDTSSRASSTTPREMDYNADDSLRIGGHLIPPHARASAYIPSLGAARSDGGDPGAAPATPIKPRKLGPEFFSLNAADGELASDIAPQDDTLSTQERADRAAMLQTMESQQDQGVLNSRSRDMNPKKIHSSDGNVLHLQLQ